MSDTEARIAELAKKLPSKLGVKKELRKLPALLLEGEEIIALDSGTYGGGNGLVVVTDRRVMFVLEGMARSRMEDFPYERISSVQSEKGMMMGKLTIFASGNKTEISNLTKALVTEVGDYIRSRVGSGGSASPGGSGESALDKLKKLGELKDAGVISEEEFAEKKAKLLEQL